MSTDVLFNLGFDYWIAFLLAFIPALYTLGLIIYMYKSYPMVAINKAYLLFLSASFAYQISDAIIRLCQSEETARAWDRLLILYWILLIPSGIRWALFLCGYRKWAENIWVIILLYFSAFFFVLPLCVGLYQQDFTRSSFWGYVRTYHKVGLFLIASMVWWYSGFSVMLTLFGR